MKPDGGTEAAGDRDVAHDPSHPDEQGLPYSPPIERPTVPAEDGRVAVAAGFGGSAEVESADRADRRIVDSAEDDLTARVRERIGAASLGSQYIDGPAIETEGATVIIDGVVDRLRLPE